MPELHDYQKRAVEFVSKAPGNYQMVDLGLGKTAIALTAGDEVGLPQLVFGPLEVIYNTWPSEILKWTPWRTFTILHGPHKDKRWKKDVDIYLINYEGLKWLYQTIYDGGFRKRKFFPVFDESSFLKNPSSKRFKMLKQLHPYFSKYRMNLSGSPAAKGLFGLWSQYYMLDGGRRLGNTQGKFTQHFNVSAPPMCIKTPKANTAKWIHNKISPITFRLDAKDHLELPDLIVNDVLIDLPAKLRKVYNDLQSSFFANIDGVELNAVTAAVLSAKLRQFLQGGLYYDDDRNYKVVHDIKARVVQQHVHGLEGKPVMIAICFRFEAMEMDKHVKDYETLIGGQGRTNNASIVRRWNEGKIEKLVVHPQTVAYGLNLQGGGSNIIFCGTPWSTELFWQLIGRLRRQGQEAKNVVVTRILFKDTIDERVAKVLKDDTKTQQDLLDAVKDYASGG